MKSFESNKLTKPATYLLLGILATGCNIDELSGSGDEIPGTPECDLPPSVLAISDDSDEDGGGNIPSNSGRNPLQVEDSLQININKTRDQLAIFSEVDSYLMEDSGITITVLSDGEFSANAESLGRMFLSQLDINYGIERLDATMDCFRRHMAEGRFAGYKIPVKVAADPRRCIRSLRLVERTVNDRGQITKCHATGGSTPGSIKELAFMSDYIDLDRSTYPVFVAPGSVALTDFPQHLVDLAPGHEYSPRYTTNPNLAMNKVALHELIHTLRWMGGVPYSLIHHQAEEDLVNYITDEVFNSLLQSDDFELPLNYSCKALEDWGHGVNDCS